MLAELRVFDMGSLGGRRDIRVWSRNETFCRSKALKYNDLASLLYALIWSCLRAFAAISSYARLWSAPQN